MALLCEVVCIGGLDISEGGAQFRGGHRHDIQTRQVCQVRQFVPTPPGIEQADRFIDGFRSGLLAVPFGVVVVRRRV
jgi:hypothetical protein